MKGCHCGTDAFLSFSMRHFHGDRVFLPPLVKGGSWGVVSASSSVLDQRDWGVVSSSSIKLDQRIGDGQ
jgi:hypothetical protein